MEYFRTIVGLIVVVARMNVIMIAIAVAIILAIVIVTKRRVVTVTLNAAVMIVVGVVAMWNADVKMHVTLMWINYKGYTGEYR